MLDGEALSAAELKQLMAAREGMTLIADMGKWWNAKYDLPLPLGVNVVRKDLGDDNMGPGVRPIGTVDKAEPFIYPHGIIREDARPPGS